MEGRGKKREEKEEERRERGKEERESCVVFSGVKKKNKNRLNFAALFSNRKNFIFSKSHAQHLSLSSFPLPFPSSFPLSLLSSPFHFLSPHFQLELTGFLLL